MNNDKLTKEKIAQCIKDAYDAYDYEQMFALMVNYSRLPNIERKIIEYLFPYDTVDITRNELASAIHSCQSDVGKAVSNLEQRGIIHAVRKYSDNRKVNPMIGCYIIEGWLENLLRIDINK